MSTEMPYSRKAEEALVGSVMIDPMAYERVASLVSAEDLHLQAARAVWQAVVDLKARGEIPDFVTVNDELERSGKLAKMGGAAYVTKLIEVVPSALHAEQYARRVAEMAHRRRLLLAAHRIAKSAYDKETDVAELQNRSEAAVLEARRNQSYTSSAGEVFGALFDDVSEWAENPQDARGLLTGLEPLDAMLGGMEPGLYLLAARPSLGKTALALQIAANVAGAGHRVVVFTLEMGEKQLALRLACSEARVPLDKIKRGVASRIELGEVVRAIGKLADWSLVMHAGTVTAGDVRAVVQRESVAEKVSLVVVDYLGLMASSKEAQNRNLELGSISRDLLLAGKDLDVPVLAIHQLNRSVEGRNNKRPLLSDLRESGRLEEDADVVLMLYRDGYYYPDSERKNVMEIWIRKNRLGGPSGRRCEMYWSGKHMRCEPLDYRKPIESR